MSSSLSTRIKNAVRLDLLGLACVCTAALNPAGSMAQEPAQGSANPMVLDRVVAVVNNHAILASDLDDEIRISVLDPGRGGLGVLTRQQALEQLISRALIQQQIRQEDETTAEPSRAEVDARLAEIRKELPACVRQNCASDAGWKAFLSSHGLSQGRVDSYLRYRLEILRFIEERFRQGISISPQEIETYYHDTLLPQYAPGEAIPTLDKVSQRIQEILLQRQVNSLFDEWLQNLRKQGDVEILDPALVTPDAQGGAGTGDGQ
jgi:peptidyl-prolyl cis-trans isomerase SurA